VSRVSRDLLWTVMSGFSDDDQSSSMPGHTCQSSYVFFSACILMFSICN
jgi:hypothetical protein